MTVLEKRRQKEVKKSGVVIKIKGELFRFVPKVNNKPGHSYPWRHLGLRHISHEKLTLPLLQRWGITTDDLKRILNLESTKEAVSSCDVIGFPSLRGKTYGWYYTIVRDNEEVLVDVWIGYYKPPASVFSMFSCER